VSPETLSRVEQALKDGFKVAQFPARVVEISKKMIPVLGDELLNPPQVGNLLVVGIGAYLLAHAERAPEPSKIDLDRLLDYLRRRLPYELKAVAKQSFNRVFAQLPRKPGSGLRKALSLDQQRQLILLVQKKEREGLSKGQAYAFAAHKFGIGKRTAQRYFATRNAIFAKRAY